MKPVFPKRFLWKLLFLFLHFSCAGSGISSNLELIGSTPGDPVVKSALTIPQATTVDFIKWNLVMNHHGQTGTFILKIHYGIGKAGTPGFENDGERKTLEGGFTILSANDRKFYRLITGKQTGLSLIMINDNLFHLLTSDNQLMIGNGGFSYTLNRRNPVEAASFSILTNAKKLLAATPTRMIIEGRTPSRPLADDHPEMGSDGSSHKLKWRLILYRDSITHKPSTYSLLQVINNQPVEKTGKWTLTHDASLHPDAVIFRLDPENPQLSISFLAGDENVFFLMDQKNGLYVGNEEFSFTLNRTGK